MKFKWRHRESQKWGVPNWGTFEMSNVMRILPILNNPFEITKIRINKYDRISDYVSFIRFVSYSNDRWRLIDKRVLRLFYNRNIWINFWLFVQKKMVKGTSLSSFLTKSAWTTTTCCQTIWNKCVLGSRRWNWKFREKHFWKLFFIFFTIFSW